MSIGPAACVASAMEPRTFLARSHREGIPVVRRWTSTAPEQADMRRPGPIVTFLFGLVLVGGAMLTGTGVRDSIASDTKSAVRFHDGRPIGVDDLFDEIAVGDGVRAAFRGRFFGCHVRRSLR